MRQYYLSLLLSVGVHGLVLGLLPSLPQTPQREPELEIISLIPVLELPAASLGLGEENFVIPPPVAEPLSVPPLDLSARIPRPDPDIPLNLSFDENPELPTRTEPPVAMTPPDNSQPPTPPQKDEAIIPKPLLGVALDPQLYTQEFANIFSELVAKCGAENVVRLTIVNPQQEVVSQISEAIAADVPWIPPVHLPTDILEGLEITVPVTLVVDEDGTISRRRFVSSNLTIIDGIILQTIDQYEGRFAPMPGKCRLVTTTYRFSGN